jgi:tRNA(Ile)-lysidine synthase
VADSRFVKDLSRALGLKCAYKKLALNKKDLSRGLSIEELLREKRYRFFKAASKAYKANILATGHTMDDQAETVLMRVIKGATIKGLVGIQPKRREGSIAVIRPLIDIEKQQILLSLKKNRISYRCDHTNNNEKFFRNTVRLKVMPYLLKYNPKLKRSLCLMSESLREDHAFIEEEKRRRELIKKNGKYVSIKLKDIVVQPKTLQREILRDAMIKSGGSVKKLTYRHWKDMDDFLKFKRKGQSIDLPGGIILKRSDDAISLRARQ